MTLSGFLEQNQLVVRIRIGRADGSTPREVGAEMFVADRPRFGTIGGGQLEYMALDVARAMLSSGQKARTMDVPLGPEIGQCCGGRVVLELAILTDKARADAVAHEALCLQQQPQVMIFGAGHVGRALARALQPLPVRARLIDSRAEEIGLAPGIDTCLCALPEAEIGHAEPGAGYVIATHDHALDFLLAAEALKRDDAAYVGMIGSRTKRARFESWLRQNDAETMPGRLICPMGQDGIGDKRPEVIAAFVTAEMMAALAAGKNIRKGMESAL